MSASSLPRSPAEPRRSRRLARRSVVGALAVGLCAAVLAPARADAAPAGAAAAGTAPTGATPATAARIDWTPCGERLECATVPVPLDWARPHGPAITLSVLRHLASDPARRIGSLLVNPGGPGDSGVDEVAARGAALDARTEGRFDIVGWDPRGSGRSTPVSCFADAAERAAFWGDVLVPTTRADERRYLARTVALAQRCGARNGALLAHISMADQVRDLDHLRRLVGDRQLTFFGESNGTLMGQTYANMFPGRVRAMALDGIVDPIAYNRGTAAALANGLTDTDLVWDRFVAQCQAAGPTRCALAGHGPVAPRVDAFLARLRRAPLPTPLGPLTYGEVIALAKFVVPAFPKDWPDVSVPMELAIEGDGTVLKQLAGGLTSDSARLAFEQNTALTCADAPSRQTAAQWPAVVHRLTQVSRIGGTAFGWVIGAPCASWPTRSAVRYSGPWGAVTRTPILLVNLRYEPNTPLVNARVAERRLGNAVLLVEDGDGHLVANNPSACVEAALTDYLVRLRAPHRGTICPSDHVPFDPAFGQS
jgi:pimeloyl-ACP methyl ester carboxylesterase